MENDFFNPHPAFCYKSLMSWILPIRQPLYSADSYRCENNWALDRRRRCVRSGPQCFVRTWRATRPSSAPLLQVLMTWSLPSTAAL